MCLAVAGINELYLWELVGLVKSVCGIGWDWLRVSALACGIGKVCLQESVGLYSRVSARVFLVTETFFFTYKSLREHNWLNYPGKWGKNWVRVFKLGGIDEDGLQGCMGLVKSVCAR